MASRTVPTLGSFRAAIFYRTALSSESSGLTEFLLCMTSKRRRLQTCMELILTRSRSSAADTMMKYSTEVRTALLLMGLRLTLLIRTMMLQISLERINPKSISCVRIFLNHTALNQISRIELSMPASSVRLREFFLL